MVKFFLDGKPAEAAEGTTLLQAAAQAGVRIPHFCHHPAFPPEGSCRLCLVEIEGLPKLELSCSTVVREGLKVWTETDKVLEARRSVLEFFLSDHPLDCPICDKAGECGLQDYFREYGLSQSVFDESKEKRGKKVPIGKNLLLDRERCVLCTRCVRFGRQVTRTEELGVFQRGLKTEIGIYDDTPVSHNYSGCLAEVCPVGAITDTDFRFKTRAWFLEKAASICPWCGRGCNITIEHAPGFPRVPGSRRIYRIKARYHPDVNGHWICDVGRYGYFHLDADRQDVILAKGKILEGPSSWEAVIRFLGARIAGLRADKALSRVGVVASSQLSNEELFLVRRLFLEDLDIRKIFLADPQEGTPDGFLLTAERTPNRKGAAEVGLKFGLPDLKSLAGELDLVFMFGLNLFDHFRGEDIRIFLSKTATKVLLTSQAPAASEAFDFVLPTAPAAEKSGSFVNIEGKVQGFAPVRPACGQALAEWDILLRLAKAVGVNAAFYSGLNGLDDIRQALDREFPLQTLKA